MEYFLTTQGIISISLVVVILVLGVALIHDWRKG